MNLLRTATLVTVFIKCVTASTDVMSQFRKAVDEGEMDKAVKLYHSISTYYNEQLKRLNYVVGKKDQAFIFEFAKQARAHNGILLTALHRKKSPNMIEEAFKVFKFDQDDLVWAASDPELICSPNDLFNLLGKIENQEEAIRGGVMNLFHNNCIDCINPLLDAFESNRSFKHLKDVAIKQAFKSGSFHENKSIVERFHDHPAVTSEDYAQGLIDSGYGSTQDPILISLLGEADQDDLIAVKKHDRYKNRPDEFKKAIDKALLTAKPGGTRSALPIQRAELVMSTFKSDSSMRIPTVISQLISFYLVDELNLELWDNPGKQSKTLTSKRQISKGLVDEEMSLMPSSLKLSAEGTENIHESDNEEE